MMKSPSVNDAVAALRKKIRSMPFALAMMASICLLTAPQLANASIYSDTYTLQTANQSMWGAGTQAGWSYNSGFLGGQWGSYAGNAPVSFGVNAMTDHWLTGRNGAAVSANSSGQVGVAVNANANGGAVAVILPVSTQLNISDPVSGVFRVSGVNTIGNGASISTVAPSFQAGVNGIINLDTSISAIGCVVGICTGSTTSANLNPGQFSIVGLNTANDKPLSAFGVDLPMVSYGNSLDITAGVQTVGHVTLNQWNDATGGNVSGGTLSMSNNQTILNLAANLTGIAQFALGFPVDVLNPSIDLGVADIKGTLLDVQAGVNLGITQSFSFDPDLQVTLVFDQPVSELQQVFTGYTTTESCTEKDYWFFIVKDCKTTTTANYVQAWVNQGNTVTINLAQAADLEFTGAVGSLLSRTYSIVDAADFTSNTLLSIDPMVAIKAGCLGLELKGGLGGINQCAYDSTYATTGLANVSIFAQTFALGGFDSASFDFAPAARNSLNVSPPFAPNGGDVPEPETLLLTTLGLLALAFTRSKTQWTQRLNAGALAPNCVAPTHA
jgi:hypothetical protein